MVIAGGAYAFTRNNKTKEYNTQAQPQTATDNSDSMHEQMQPTSTPEEMMSGQEGSDMMMASSTASSSGDSMMMASGTPEGAMMAAQEKTFTVTGQNFSFSPSTITVNKGDKVKIIFQNSDGFHDFVLDGYNVSTPKIQSGQSATVEFTADKTGTFPYYCSVANHRAMGMEGSLIVQ